ncbi:MAG: GTPase Era [Betaproteobacteria bacterium]|nr:GTPase Era [Rhodocyclaceae bacterium]MCG3186279.1 GTPase Era [Rhodocyclaceae bacterium]
MSAFKCGLIAIVGRPNVGKSTLLNRLVGFKLSIISSRPQTTRHKILGVLSEDERQFVFVDTPGYQQRHRSALNRLMNKQIQSALAEVDAVLWLIDARRLTAEDRQLIPLLPASRPVILAMNKVDALSDRNRLLPMIDSVRKLHPFAEIVPISAESGDNVEALKNAVAAHLPDAPAMFDADTVTDRSERFLAAEYVREKLFRRLGEEIPYGTAVQIERFEQGDGQRRIAAVIWVDRPAHKRIVIGQGGEALKAVASAARRDMEESFGGKVFLEVWVKVKSGWANDERAALSLSGE